MSNYFELPEYSAILTFLDAVLAQINMGVLIYHAEDPDDETRLKLIYANKEASRCTGADLRPEIGRHILDAFPSLAQTDVPKRFLEVHRSGEPTRFGPMPYRDQRLAQRSYTVRAFPMPNRCVGVLFEEAGGDDPSR